MLTTFVDLVNEEISLVEHHLKTRHSAVSQLLENAYRTTSQELQNREGRLPNQDANFLGDEDLGFQNRAPTAGNIPVPINDQENGPVAADPGCQSPSEAVTSGDGGPLGGARAEARSQSSNFILGLSE